MINYKEIKQVIDDLKQIDVTQIVVVYTVRGDDNSYVACSYKDKSKLKKHEVSN